MKPEVAKQWCEALRSGKYKQTAGTLRNQHGFCCLGVLCDISKLHEWGGNPGIQTYGPHNTRLGILPDDVMDWAGMKSKNGRISPTKVLTELNDSGKTFAEIADIIEQNVEAL